MPFLIGVLLGEGSREFFKKGEEERREEEAGDVLFYHLLCIL